MAANVTDPALWLPFQEKPVQRRKPFNFDMVITVTKSSFSIAASRESRTTSCGTSCAT
jgi:hypothetical protein